ncbi:MAG: hypothetical protein JSR77_11045 [Planctomycetes bacterium]|nr:hypothetical protein [Planctomycetota bacterium]
MVRLIALACGLLFSHCAALAQSTSFVYQGRLEESGAPVTGTYDLRFLLYSGSSSGLLLAGPYCADNVSVTDGLFAVEVGLTLPTSGADTYLEIQTRLDTGLTCNNGTGFIVLAPRVKLTPAPKSVFASAVPESSPTIPGALRFNATLKRFEGYDGVFWYPFTMGTAIAPANTQDFTTAGVQVFTVPAGVNRLGVDIFGAGGGGGGRGTGLDAPTTGTCNSGTPGYASGGGGGGAGGYGRFSIAVTPGEVLAIEVGSGGGAGGNGVPGASGSITRVRRGLTDLVTAAGAAGGSAGTSVNMGVSADGSCLNPGILGGSPGAGGAAPTMSGAGTGVSTAAGSVGQSGYGPSCYSSTFPPSTTRCPSAGGFGGNQGGLGGPLSTIGAGAGGRGGSYSTVSLAGSPGRVRLFWN